MALIPLALALACESSAGGSRYEGAAGVFYGGQVQELKVVTISAIRPQPVGFRLVRLGESSSEPVDVRWEVVRPGPAGRRIKVTGSARFPADSSQLDQVIDVPRDARLGTFNVRVLVGSDLIIDRAILLRPE